ncbi:MAG: hypothetical protein ICV74_08545 [Thermoleophilia bacterium]|nr:hypothetical protein [Thermoleophilia bacterium]
MTTAEKYVTAAYLVVLAVVLLYVVVYAFKLARLARELEELSERAAAGDGARPASRGRSPRIARQ